MQREIPDSDSSRSPVMDKTPNYTEEIDGLRRMIATLERDLAAVARHTPGVERKNRSQSSGRAVADAMWKCRKCGSLLGFYDVDEDILRVREKLQVTFIKVGGANVDAMAKVALAVGAAHKVDADIVAEMMAAVAEYIDLGLVQVVCRHCSAVNTQHYAAQPTGSPATE